MRFKFLVFSLFLSGLTAIPAVAQDGFANLAPLSESAMEDGAPIQMSPDGPSIIRLDEDAASVIIGNPAQATAVLENPRMIMLLPQQPGATKIVALNSAGKTILNRHVLVGGGKSKFMRINRACAAGATNCQPVSMYYCPDRCYETGGAQAPAGVTPALADMGGSASSDMSAPDVPDSIGENPISIGVPDVVQ